MLKTLKNAWGIPELRKKIMFTVLILLLYRIGNVMIQTEKCAFQTVLWQL